MGQLVLGGHGLAPTWVVKFGPRFRQTLSRNYWMEPRNYLHWALANTASVLPPRVPHALTILSGAGTNHKLSTLSSPHQRTPIFPLRVLGNHHWLLEPGYTPGKLDALRDNLIIICYTAMAQRSVGQLLKPNTQSYAHSNCSNHPADANTYLH